MRRGSGDEKKSPAIPWKGALGTTRAMSLERLQSLLVHQGIGSPAIPLGALGAAGGPWGKALVAAWGHPLLGKGGQGHPPPAPTRRAGEPGEDVPPFWRMPPLIPNNAPDGPAGTSLVRDVARSELVPGREVERGDRDPAHTTRDFQRAKKRGSFEQGYNKIMAFQRGGEGKAQGLEHPSVPTYLSPVALGTAGAFPGGDGHSATTTTWDKAPSPPRGDRDQWQQRVELAQPSKGHCWGMRERRDVAFSQAWVQLGAGLDPSATPGIN